MARALDILECFGRAIDALLDGILEALFRTGNNLRNSGYRHCFLLRGIKLSCDPLTCGRLSSGRDFQRASMSKFSRVMDDATLIDPISAMCLFSLPALQDVRRLS
jgi:hypothetical protein